MDPHGFNFGLVYIFNINCVILKIIQRRPIGYDTSNGFHNLQMSPYSIVTHLLLRILIIYECYIINFINII